MKKCTLIKRSFIKHKSVIAKGTSVDFVVNIRYKVKFIYNVGLVKSRISCCAAVETGYVFVFNEFNR